MTSRYEHPYPDPAAAAAYPFEPLDSDRVETDEMRTRGQDFFHLMSRRRSVRMLSGEPVPFDIVETAIRAAATAPSGANHQPWRFAVTGDPGVKRQIRAAAEEEERINYGGRMNQTWRDELAPLGTDHHKEFLEVAPWIVVLFEERYGVDDDGHRRPHYYVKESVGIAAGMFVTALHTMGLATLPHTPTPMNFLTKILGRPDNERPFVLFPIGRPLEGCLVPVVHRKALQEVMVVVGERPADPDRRTD